MQHICRGHKCRVGHSNRVLIEPFDGHQGRRPFERLLFLLTLPYLAEEQMNHRNGKGLFPSWEQREERPSGKH